MAAELYARLTAGVDRSPTEVAALAVAEQPGLDPVAFLVEHGRMTRDDAKHAVKLLDDAGTVTPVSAPSTPADAGGAPPAAAPVEPAGDDGLDKLDMKGLYAHAAEIGVTVSGNRKAAIVDQIRKAVAERAAVEADTSGADGAGQGDGTGGGDAAGADAGTGDTSSDSTASS